MNNLTIHTWRKGHLDTSVYTTDAYYLGMANKLFRVLWNAEPRGSLEKEMAEEWALALAYYFEDVVSGIGVWQAFTTKHKELYGRYLPFYEIIPKEYYPGEVNLEDISFILWMCLQKSKNASVVNPENPFLLMMSAAVYEVLDAEFERAPMNEALLDNLKTLAESDDFFLIKGLFLRLAMQSYLFKPFVEGRREAIDTVIDAYLGEKIAPGAREYAFHTLLAFRKKTGPLSLYTKDWLTLMLTQWGLKKEAQKIAAIEVLPYSIFLVENHDADYLFLKEVTGNTFKVLRDAFDGSCSDSMLQQNKVLISSLVQYDGVWMPNGLSVWYASTHVFDSFVSAKAKQEEEEGPCVSLRTLDGQSPMRYFRTTQAYVDWMRAHYACNENLIVPNEMLSIEFPAVYLCEDDGALFIPNGARVIFDKENPYYNKAIAQENALAFLVSDTMTPKDVLHHLVDNKMLPDAHLNHILGPKRGLAIVQQNLDFLARFMRNDDY